MPKSLVINDIAHSRVSQIQLKTNKPPNPLCLHLTASNGDRTLRDRKSFVHNFPAIACKTCSPIWTLVTLLSCPKIWAVILDNTGDICDQLH